MQSWLFGLVPQPVFQLHPYLYFSPSHDWQQHIGRGMFWCVCVCTTRTCVSRPVWCSELHNTGLLILFKAMKTSLSHRRWSSDSAFLHVCLFFFSSWKYSLKKRKITTRPLILMHYSISLRYNSGGQTVAQTRGLISAPICAVDSSGSYTGLMATDSHGF